MKTIRYLNARQRDEPLFAITLACIKGREAIFDIKVLRRATDQDPARQE